MADDDDASLTDLARAVLEGTPVDWDATAAASREPERSLIEQLRVLADITDLHRHLASTADPVFDARAQPAEPEGIGQWGHLTLLECVGRGAFGEVYRAWDRRLQREVGLKLLRRSDSVGDLDASATMGEARLLARVRHPNVVSVFDADVIDGQVGIWMEFVRGSTLEHLLDDRGPLPAGEAAAIGVSLCRALSAVHDAGLLHRDLTAQNVVRDSAGRVVLMDFGTSRNASTPDWSVTADMRGTPLYMAPELFSGTPATIQSDLYSLGIVLYHLVTGTFPVTGRTLQDIQEAHRTRAGADLQSVPPDVPKPFRRVIEQAVAVDPRARYETAGEMQAALEQSFDAESDSLQSERPSAPLHRRTHARRWLAAAIVVAITGAGLSWRTRAGSEQPTVPGFRQLRLAVLPFVNRTGDDAQDYLGDGLADGLTTELARLHPEQLSVIGRTTAVRYRATRPDVSQIGRDLGVDYFIEGSTSRVDGKLRIDVRLARARDQTQVWAERYDREQGDLRLVQADVARAIAREMSVSLTPEQQARLASATPIVPDAYEHYLKGRYFAEKRTERGLKRSVEEFEAATRLHPGYAAAHAGIASSYLLLAYYAYVPPEQAFTLARAAGVQALALDARLPEAHVALAGIYNDYDRRWDDAEAEYRAALHLDPNHPTANQWYANHLIARGRRAEAQTHILRARDLDPLSLIIQVNVANIFLLSRQDDRAITECRKALEMDEDFVTARWVLGRADELQGRHREAVAEFERALRREPDSTLLRSALARTYAMSGATAKADTILRTLNESAEQRYVSALDVASVHAALGHTDEAFRSLERGVRERANLLSYLNVDPAFDSLHGDPRFGRILASIGLE